MVADRIAVESRIACRDENGHRCTVLCWRRQHDDDAQVSPGAWYGAALFTLADSSAVLQIGGSTLQVVATGMVLEVMAADHDDVPVLTDVVPDTVASLGMPAWVR